MFVNGPLAIETQILTGLCGECLIAIGRYVNYFINITGVTDDDDGDLSNYNPAFTTRTPENIFFGGGGNTIRYQSKAYLPGTHLGVEFHHSAGIIYCRVLVKKCPGAYSTQWRYIVHVINSLIKVMLFILWHPISLYWGGHWVTRILNFFTPGLDWSRGMKTEFRRPAIAGFYDSTRRQWRNRRGGRGGRVPPQRLLTGKFLLTYREKRGKEKRERGENWVEKVENWKWKQENVRKRGEDLFFFFFFFFLLFTFENDENLFWVYQNGNFLPGKSISRREKNQEKWLCPLRKICLLRPCPEVPAAIILLTWVEQNQLVFQKSLKISCFCLISHFKKEKMLSLAVGKNGEGNTHFNMFKLGKFHILYEKNAIFELQLPFKSWQSSSVYWGTVHKHLLAEGVLMQKGPLKVLILVRGSEEKKKTILQRKLRFYRWGWSIIFYSKKEGLDFFFLSDGGGGRNFRNEFLFASCPHKCSLGKVCKNLKLES